MANNKVTFGGQTIMDITDTTAEPTDVASGEVFYDRSGVRQVGTGNYMSKVANPSVNDVLLTDGNGQAIDSGVSVSELAQMDWDSTNSRASIRDHNGVMSVNLVDTGDGFDLSVVRPGEYLAQRELVDKTYVDTELATKQDTLVSGTNIKTINNNSLLGSGNVSVATITGDRSSNEIAINDDRVPAMYIAIGEDNYSGNPIMLLNGYYISGYGTLVFPTFDGVQAYVDGELATKQDALVSGSNIKSINNESLLGSGNLDIQGTPPIQTQGNWKYRIYPDNTFEAWYKQTGYSIGITTSSGNLYRSNLTSLALPSNIYNDYDCNIIDSSINVSHNNYPTWGMLASIYATGINFYALSGGSRNANPNHLLTARVFGTLTAK